MGANSMKRISKKGIQVLSHGIRSLTQMYKQITIVLLNVKRFCVWHWQCMVLKHILSKTYNNNTIMQRSWWKSVLMARYLLLYSSIIHYPDFVVLGFQMAKKPEHHLDFRWFVIPGVDTMYFVIVYDILLFYMTGSTTD